MTPMKATRILRTITVIFLLGALVSGCTPSLQDGVYQKTVDGVTIYRGTQTRRYAVSDDQPQALTIHIERRSGSLGIRILHLDTGDYVYRGSDLPTSTFTVNLETAGEYTLTITADDFCGSFRIADDSTS